MKFMGKKNLSLGILSFLKMGSNIHLTVMRNLCNTLYLIYNLNKSKAKGKYIKKLHKKVSETAQFFG